MALRLTLIGPPHSGKHTQARALRQNGFVCAFKDELPPSAASGEAGDDVLFGAVREFFGQHQGRSIVLVGYPGDVRQAEQLATLGLDAAIFFDASDETMLRRVGNCLVGPGGHVQPPLHAPGAPADEEAAADYKQRLAVYREMEAPLREFYTKAGLARSVLAGYPEATVRAQVADLIADLHVSRARATAS